MNDQNQQPEPISEPVYPTPNTPQPKRNSKNKDVIIAALAILLLITLGILAYLLLNGYDKQSSRSINISEDEQQVAKDDEIKPTRFTSKLWPDLAFDAPSGWTVSEPEVYEPTSQAGAKFVDGKIFVKDGDTTLTLSLSTVRVMGVTGASCYTKENLQKIKGDIYRFTDGDKISIESGYTATSSEWKDITNLDSNTYNDYSPGNNFCQGWPFIGTYSSTVKQADYPNYPYGYNGNTNVMAFLSAEATGDLSATDLEKIDAVVKSLSDSAPVALQ